MPNVTINFRPLDDCTYPDVTGTPIEEWLTVKAYQAKGSHTIEIDALKEYSLRTGGKEAPPSERLTWRQYFSWLARVEPDDRQPWNELRIIAEKRLKKLFGYEEEIRNNQKVPVQTIPISQPKVRKPKTETSKNNRSRYNEVLLCDLPGTSERTFNDIYVNNGGNGDGKSA